jgi:hypothetical protein
MEKIKKTLSGYSALFPDCGSRMVLGKKFAVIGGRFSASFSA